MRQNDKDFIKGVLIVIVIWGHVCPDSAGNYYASQWNAVSRITGMFAMPLFFILSGYFQKPIDSLKGVWISFKKVITRIGLPLFAWGLLAVILNGNYYELWRGDILWAIKNIIYTITNYLWYLPCLIICVLISLIPNYIRNKKPYLAIILNVIFIPILHCFSFDFFHVTFMYPFFVLGILTRHYNDKIKKLLSNRVVNVLLVIVLVGILIKGGLTPNETFYCKRWNKEVVDLGYMLGRWFYYLIVTVCAFYWFTKLYECCAESKFSNAVVTLGRETLYLYAAHMTLLTYIYKPIIRYFTSGNGLFQTNHSVLYYVYAPLATIIIIVALIQIKKLITPVPRMILCGETLRK